MQSASLAAASPSALRSRLAGGPLSTIRIALVTEELAGLGSSGGIGAAILECAHALAGAGADVEILLLPLREVVAEREASMRAQLAAAGIALRIIQPDRYVWGEPGPEKRSYCVYRAVQESEKQYDFVHVHDYKGLGFFAQNAKRQKLDFARTVFVVQAHGTSRWAASVNRTIFSHVDQLKLDFMEQRSLELADYVVSPSQYLVDWLSAHGVRLPPSERVRILRNPCELAQAAIRMRREPWRATSDVPTGPELVRAAELILFARHEDRKGVLEFADALDLLNPLLSRKRVQVTLLGALGEIAGHPSGIFLTRRARHWTFPISVHTTFDRVASLDYLRQAHDAVVVVPSHEENSPYAVVEAILAGRPVVTSNRGGARELLDPSVHDALLCDITPVGLARTLRIAVERGLPPARLAETPERTALTWTVFHQDAIAQTPAGRPDRRRTTARTRQLAAPALPSVVLGITHFERPGKLTEAIISGMRQTYANLEVVVVDDGSTQPATLMRLGQIETLLRRCGGRLIRRANGYLGAARNEIMRSTESDYLVFLDDDDLALPTMVETLVHAAVATGAEMTTCFNVFLDARDRAAYAADPATYVSKLSYAPLGGPLSAAAIENCLGAATTLFRRSALQLLGGYTELIDVGHEDYELYVRALQAGMTIDVVPRPLYLYETGRPSMMSRTSVKRNFHRVGLAIDVAARPDAWRDALLLLTAQSGAAHSANRRAWEYRSDPHSDLLMPLLSDGTVAPEIYAGYLADYAEAIGARDMVRVWRRSVDPALLASDDAGEAGPDLTWSLSEILLLLAGHQDRTAAEQCLAQLVDADCIDAPLLSVVENVITRIDATECRDQLSALADALADASVATGLTPKWLVTRLRAATRLKDPAREELALRELFAFEEADYLRLYPDIGDAIGTTELRSGLHHFLIAGRHEGRTGFGMLASLGQSTPVQAVEALTRTGRRLEVLPTGNGSAKQWSDSEGAPIAIVTQYNKPSGRMRASRSSEQRGPGSTGAPPRVSRSDSPC